MSWTEGGSHCRGRGATVSSTERLMSPSAPQGGSSYSAEERGQSEKGLGGRKERGLGQTQQKPGRLPPPRTFWKPGNRAPAGPQKRGQRSERKKKQNGFSFGSEEGVPPVKTPASQEGVTLPPGRQDLARDCQGPRWKVPRRHAGIKVPGRDSGRDPGAPGCGAVRTSCPHPTARVQKY